MTSVPRFVHPPGRMRFSVLRIASILVAMPLAATWFVSPAPAQGILGGIRADVRTPSPSEDDDNDDHRRGDGHGHSDYHGDCHDGSEESLSSLLARWTLTSPFWLPAHLMQDDYDREALFPRFPYDNVPGYMVVHSWPGNPAIQPGPLGPGSDLPMTATLGRLKSWSGRFRLEYADDFDAVGRFGGHMLLETTSRFGLDGSLDYLEETLPGGRNDYLSLGDLNVVFRFAQCEHAQMRTGIGLNWLDDTVETNYGFNFTYGADFFPARPWILSADLDWGTIDHTSLFRFRTTAGLIVNRLETYVGYEYLDIGQTQVNSLIAGVRVWF